MRYRSLVASTAVLLGVAACRGNDTGLNADLAKDLAAAKTSDALALAPHAGEQTVVSAQELSPNARVRLQSSARSTHAVARHTPQKARVAPEVSNVASETPAPQETEVATTPVVATGPSDPAATVATAPEPSRRPHPMDGPAPGSAQGGSQGGGTGETIGGIIGAIGGAILRGGVVDGDNCDPRGHRNRGGGILINRRGPILRGHF
jgi:hypothetical protein